MSDSENEDIFEDGSEDSFKDENEEQDITIILDDEILKSENENEEFNNFENIKLDKEFNKFNEYTNLMDKKLLEYEDEKNEINKNYEKMNLNDFVNDFYEYIIHYSGKNENYENNLFNDNFVKYIKKDDSLMYYFLKNKVLTEEVNERMKILKGNNLSNLLFKNEDFVYEYNLINIFLYEKNEFIEPLYQNIMKNNFYMNLSKLYRYYFTLNNLKYLNKKTLKELLEQKNKNNETILHLYANNNNYSRIREAISMIKKYKILVDLNIQDNNGDTFLMIMAKKATKNTHRTDCLDILRYIDIINYDINLSIINKNNETLLKIAFKKRLYHLLSYLSMLKKDLNLSVFKDDDKLDNLLSFKFLKRNINYILIFKRLLENQPNDILKIPEIFEYYREMSFIDTKNAISLMDNNPIFIKFNIYDSMKKLFKYGHYEVFLKYVKEYPEYLSYIDENNETLLIYILKLNKPYDDRSNNFNNINDIIKLKLEEIINEILDIPNINISHIDNLGNNAFMYICKNNYINIFLKIYKRNDYDKNLINKDGYHALYLNSLNKSEHFLFQEYNPISDILLKTKNYDLNMTDAEGNNIIMNYLKNLNVHHSKLIYECIKLSVENNDYDIINHKNMLNENILYLFLKCLFKFEYIDELMYDYELGLNHINENKINNIKDYLYNCNLYIKNNDIKNKPKDIIKNVYANIVFNILITESNDILLFNLEKDTLFKRLIKNLSKDNIEKVLLKYTNKLKDRNLYNENIKLNTKKSFDKISKMNIKRNRMFYHLNENVNENSIIFILLTKNEKILFEDIFIELNQLYKDNNIINENKLEFIFLIDFIVRNNSNIVRYFDIFIKYLNYDELINIFRCIIEKRANGNYLTENEYIINCMIEKYYEKLNLKLENLCFPNELINNMTNYTIDSSFYRNNKIKKNIQIIKKKKTFFD